MIDLCNWIWETTTKPACLGRARRKLNRISEESPVRLGLQFIEVFMPESDFVGISGCLHHCVVICSEWLHQLTANNKKSENNEFDKTHEWKHFENYVFLVREYRKTLQHLKFANTTSSGWLGEIGFVATSLSPMFLNMCLNRENRKWANSSFIPICVWTKWTSTASLFTSINEEGVFSARKTYVTQMFKVQMKWAYKYASTVQALNSMK